MGKKASYYACLNLYLSMWFSPRKTIRAIVDSNPSQGVRFLATILALENFFFYANAWSLGLTLNSKLIILIGLLVSPYWGYIWIVAISYVFFWTGRWLGGNASLEEVRAANAWSKIPAIGILCSWICILFIAPDEAFIYAGGGNPVIIFFNFFNFIFACWSIILLVQSIREVQHFPFLKTVANIFLGWILFSLPLMIFIFLAMLLLNF